VKTAKAIGVSSLPSLLWRAMRLHRVE
jgi:hypothetical protein